MCDLIYQPRSVYDGHGGRELLRLGALLDRRGLARVVQRVRQAARRSEGTVLARWIRLHALVCARGRYGVRPLSMLVA